MGEFDNLHQILLSLYDEMMPLCADMTGVAKGLAGLGALFYVAMRVWQSLARAEAIDVYPLLRPFALGLCILFFPTIVLGTMNSVLSPIVQGVHGILEEQTFDMNEYREQKDKLEYEALMRNPETPETAYLASDEEFDRQLDELGWSPSDLVTMTGMYMDRAAYNIKKSVRDWFRELLELMFAAAALIIDTLRTFFLVVLSILGPIAFAFSVWDGFHSTLSAWFSRYIQIYLWLPADTDAPAGHRAYADRPELLAGRERRGVHRVPYHRHRGLFHHTDGGGLDYPSRWRHRQLQQEHRNRRGFGRQRGRCSRRKRGGACREAHQGNGRKGVQEVTAGTVEVALWGCLCATLTSPKCHFGKRILNDDFTNRKRKTKRKWNSNH